jgi:hypothetical protein
VQSAVSRSDCIMEWHIVQGAVSNSCLYIEVAALTVIKKQYIIQGAVSSSDCNNEAVRYTGCCQ